MTLAEAASVRCQTWRLEVSVFLASAVAAHTACRIRPMSWGRHRCCFGVPPTWRVDAPRAKRKNHRTLGQSFTTWSAASTYCLDSYTGEPVAAAIFHGWLSKVEADIYLSTALR